MAVIRIPTLVLRGVSVVVRDVVAGKLGLASVVANPQTEAMSLRMRHPSQRCHLAGYEARRHNRASHDANDAAPRAGRPGSRPGVSTRRRTTSTQWSTRMGQPCRTAWRFATPAFLGTALPKRLTTLGTAGLTAGKTPTVGRVLAGSTRGEKG